MSRTTIEAVNSKKLTLPAALAVAVLSAAGCDDGSEDHDAAVRDAAPVADAAFDAGCEDFEEYDPETMMCQPLPV